jgi:hypothetical protein
MLEAISKMPLDTELLERSVSYCGKCDITRNIIERRNRSARLSYFELRFYGFGIGESTQKNLGQAAYLVQVAVEGKTNFTH